MTLQLSGMLIKAWEWFVGKDTHDRSHTVVGEGETCGFLHECLVLLDGIKAYDIGCFVILAPGGVFCIVPVPAELNNSVCNHHQATQVQPEIMQKLLVSPSCILV